MLSFQKQVSDVVSISSYSVTPLLTKCDTEDLKMKASEGSSFDLSTFSSMEPAPNQSSPCTGLFSFSFSAPSISG